MLVIKAQFIIASEDAKRVRELNTLVYQRDSILFTPKEREEIHKLWDKYPIDGWVDGIGRGIIKSEMLEWKGCRQKVEHIKLNLLCWVADLPIEPSLNFMWSRLLNRYAARRIYQAAYNIS